MAYIAVVSSPMKNAERISRSLGIFVGKCDVTTYDTTLEEITGITKFFYAISNTETQAAKYPHGVLSVTPTGLSDNGHLFEWDATTGAFKCYKPTNIVISGSATGAAITVLLTENAIAAASTEGAIVATAVEAAAVDVGEIGFIAVGFIR